MILVVIFLSCLSFVCCADDAAAGIKDNGGADAVPDPQHPVGAIPLGGAAAVDSPANPASPPPPNAGASVASGAVAKPGQSPEDDAFLQVVLTYLDKQGRQNSQLGSDSYAV